jgi:hypothetical protein
VVEEKLSPMMNKDLSESAPNNKLGFGNLFKKLGDVVHKNPRERKSTL